MSQKTEAAVVKTFERTKPGPFAGVLYTLPQSDKVKYQPMVFKTNPNTGEPTSEKLHHEFWRLRPSPSFKRNDGKGQVYVNINISYRKLRGELVQGPRFPEPGKTVVCDGYVEMKHVRFMPKDAEPYTEEHLLIALYVTDRPLAEATQTMKFPEVADGDLTYGDVRIPMTGHAIRFVPRRVKTDRKPPADERGDMDDLPPAARIRWRMRHGG